MVLNLLRMFRIPYWTMYNTHHTKSNDVILISKGIDFRDGNRPRCPAHIDQQEGAEV